MIIQQLRRLKQAANDGLRTVLPPTRRALVDDASLVVPFGPDARGPISPDLRIAVMCHLFHLDMCGLIQDVVSQIPHPVDLLISTDTDDKREIIENAFRAWCGGTVTVCVVENRGRDIAPKLVTFANTYGRYDLVLFLHTKKSQHYQHGDAWRDGLLRSLVGSPETVGSIVHLFSTRPEIGMVIAQHFEPLREWIFWNGNFLRAWKIARRMGLALPWRGPIDFPSGSMFWARPNALAPLTQLGLTLPDFPPERGQINKTVHHAIERLLLFSCEHAGFGWLKVTDLSASTGASPRHRVERASDIAAFVAARSWFLLPSARRGRYVRPRSAIGGRPSTDAAAIVSERPTMRDEPRTSVGPGPSHDRDGAACRSCAP